MDPGSMPIEQASSTIPQGQGQGPAAMAEQPQAAGTHTQAATHGGAHRTFSSMTAAEKHIRQQERIITKQARSTKALATRIDSLSIDLAQLLSLVKHREVAPGVGEWSADRYATSAFGVSSSKPILIPPPESTPAAAHMRQSSAEVLSAGESPQTDPARQARREFLGRDRASASPLASRPGATPHVTHARPRTLLLRDHRNCSLVCSHTCRRKIQTMVPLRQHGLALKP